MAAPLSHRMGEGGVHERGKVGKERRHVLPSRLAPQVAGPRKREQRGKPVVECPYTRLYSFKFSCRMVSFTAANTNLMFSVSVAQVK